MGEALLQWDRAFVACPPSFGGGNSSCDGLEVVLNALDADIDDKHRAYLENIGIDIDKWWDRIGLREIFRGPKTAFWMAWIFRGWVWLAVGLMIPACVALR